MIPTVSEIQFEHFREPLGLGTEFPRLSWRTVAAPGWSQSRYQLEVTRNFRTATTSWVRSPDSVLIAWPFDPLQSRERATVRVRVGDNGKQASAWSTPSPVEAGLLRPADWLARSISAPWPEKPDSDRRPPLLRREFTAVKQVEKARLYATAHGVYELEINGRRVGADALNPGWTAYGSRLRYYTYDVTELVVTGGNVIGAWLGDGWYRGRIGFGGGHRNLYGNDLTLIAQLEITYADGTKDTVSTDDLWRAAFGPVVFTELYNGENYDARDEFDGWSSAGFDAAEWLPVAVAAHETSLLVAPDGPPVRCTEELSPVSILTTPSGKTVLDFGQNAAGRLRIRVSGPAGHTVTLRHAEVMQDGEIYTRSLRDAAATDTYTLRGGDAREWEPRFTMHGFRFVEVSGWPGRIVDGDIVFRVYHTDLRRTGWFSCSDSMLERLHDNVVWSMRSNFMDIPTDCPQRDERLGWTGDIQVFTATASFLYDCAGMLTGWLKDVEAEQLPDGTVPWYVPTVPAGDEWTPIKPGAVWGDVAVLTPWKLYERFGDLGVLAQQYASAKAWIDLVDRLAGPSHLWNTGFQLGDWLDPAAPPDDPADARTDRYLVATAYFAWSALHLSRMAAELGRHDDAARYDRLSAAVKRAFEAEYVLSDGRITSDAQTAYSLALAFDLLSSKPLRASAAARLSSLVAAEGNRIGTGFAGTPLIADALSQSGFASTAYRLVMERKCPSWLYMVEQGATTMWERWDSQLPDGTINPSGMTSFNHYALGSIADWLHRVVAGLSPLEAGYRRILVRPEPGGGLTHAAAEHITPYGRAAVSWNIHQGGMSVLVNIPTGTTARVELPGIASQEVSSGYHRFDITAAQLDAGPHGFWKS